MTEIFYENATLASLFFALVLFISQMNIFLIKRLKADKIDGLEYFFQNTLAYSSRKFLRGYFYFVFTPMIIYFIYYTFIHFSHTGFFYSLFVFFISGIFSLSLSLTIALFISAILTNRKEDLPNFLTRMYMILIIIGISYGLGYFLTSEAFYQNGMVFILLTAVFNFLKLRKAKKITENVSF